MLSILIPIYNQEVVSLVDDLTNQCEKLKFPYQILVFDDCSLPHWKAFNESLHGKINVNYLELSENFGRAKIRNKLVQMARYDKLIFLDGDSKVITTDYVEKYLTLSDQYKVIYGGTAYPLKGINPNKMLHWKFGSKREALPAFIRAKQPWESFKTNNFFACKEVFDLVKFDESLTKYGYEDTVFAAELENKHIAIKHIDNSVEHTGLSDNEEFIKKTEQSIENLTELIQKKKLKPTKLVRTWHRCDQIGFWSLPSTLHEKMEKYLFNHLKTNPGSLLSFNLWKLMVFNRQQKSLSKIR